MFTLRFDMRAPAAGAPAADLYAAALDMCSWAETRGAIIAVLSEHHAADDDHLPAPLTLAAAIAARTDHLGILLAAVVLPLWDPVRLAEEMAVLDIISKGRVSYALGIGHRPEEYDHFGIDVHARGRLADEYLPVVLKLVRGETVEYRGRSVTVTPPASSSAGPTVLVAGGSKAAARRAASAGLGFISQSSEAGLQDYYDEQCRVHGHEPGPMQMPVDGAPTAVFVADDVEAAWDELGSFLLHDARTAAAYRRSDSAVASITRAETVADLRKTNGPYRILTADDATTMIRSGRPLPLLPLCGGLPPAVAWPYLERAARATESARTQPKSRG